MKCKPYIFLDVNCWFFKILRGTILGFSWESKHVLCCCYFFIITVICLKWQKSLMGKGRIYVFRTILMKTKPKIIPIINDIFFRTRKPWFEFGFTFCQKASKAFIFRILFCFCRCDEVNLTQSHRYLVIRLFKLYDR